MDIRRISKQAISPHGFKHHYECIIPKDPLALAIYVHGLGDHTKRYLEFAEVLAHAGIACGMYDQRGFGLSDGMRGHISQFYDLVHDLSCFVPFCSSKLHDEVPVFLVGSSMGALVCLSYVLTHAAPIWGLIIMNAAMEPTVRISHLKKRIGLFFARFFPSFMTDNGIATEDLTRDKSEIELIESDPLKLNKMNIGTGKEFLTQIKFIKSMISNLDLPTFMLVGSADRVCHPNGTKKLAMKLQSDKHTYRMYSGMYHDLLHDLGREEVSHDIIEWILYQTSIYRSQESTPQRQLLKHPYWSDID